MPYEKKDFYHRKAKEEGFLARSAYKLQEIQKKFKLIKNGNGVLDLGCAPGAWTQVALPLVGPKGIVIGIDLEKVELKHDRFRFIHGDAFKLKTEDLPEGPFHVVLSDMAPKTSGVKVRDQARSAELCLHALMVAKEHLIPGGSLVVKLFEGEDANDVRAQIQADFRELKLFRPESTRTASKEIYLVAQGKL
ncbi:MAG: RlmE family RNA methyltransferase [Proteobacteria bacterium]|nr:MAG: RlmE family RNA methyltransferase [Pseudomonadota bacterium]